MFALCMATVFLPTAAQRAVTDKANQDNNNLPDETDTREKLDEPRNSTQGTGIHDMGAESLINSTLDPGYGKCWLIHGVVVV